MDRFISNRIHQCSSIMISKIGKCIPQRQGRGQRCGTPLVASRYIVSVKKPSFFMNGKTFGR
ncbi:MAG: hypothetical protein OXC68_14830, partial [Aestuariivita sp.]|nr:hypothetical protein [Aestuariivita sp.]